MKKILLYLTPEKHVSAYDLIVAYDSGAEIVITYPSVEIFEVKDIIYDAIFSRSPARDMAIFISGHNFEKCQNLFDESVRIVNSFPKNLQVSITFDPDGACTTSAAMVAKVKSSLKGFFKKKVVILAGTGPVGQCSSLLLAKKEKCSKISITSRKLEKAKEITEKLDKMHKIKIEPLQGSSEEEIEFAVKDADIVFSTGTEGTQLLPKKIWLKNSKIKAMADVNAVFPLGIEGVDANDNGIKKEGKICFGALAIGNLKIKVHHELIKKLFEKKEIFDLEKIYELTSTLIKKS